MDVSWTIEKAECQRTDAFEVWCWRRLVSVPWTARSSQSILNFQFRKYSNEYSNPEYSLEGLILKLKFQYFGHLMGRVDSLEKTLMLGKIESRRRRGWQDEMVGWCHRLKGHGFEQALGDGEGQGSLASCSSWGHKELDMTEWVTEKQQWYYQSITKKSLLYNMPNLLRKSWRTTKPEYLYFIALDKL